MNDPAAQSPAIELLNVTHHYGIRPVLRDISLSIPRGELVALMGPNGMGKSTLMALMAGAMSPARGQVRINGQLRRGDDETEIAIRRSVVHLPASPFLAAVLTGWNWVMSAGRIWGRDELDLMDHCGRLMELFELTEKQDAPIHSYSTGQRKKLALASALITQAPIMLFDEPFSGGLDPSGITALTRVLQRIRDQRAATIVLASPVPEMVEELADRIAVVRNGRIEAFDSLGGLRISSGCAGSLAEVYEKLFSPQTAANVDRYFSANGKDR